MRVCAMMGSTTDLAPNVQKRLVASVARMPELDRRIARKRASTCFHLQLRYLNVARAAAQAECYKLQKVRQHMETSKFWAW